MLLRHARNGFLVLKHNRMAKCDVTKIKICERMGFVGLIRAINTKNVSLQKISMLVKMSARYYQSYALTTPYKFF